MDRMFFMCKKIVELNTKVMDPETIDLLATSIMAIVIERGIDVVDQLPTILKSINIISDNRSVLQVEHQDLNNYREDNSLKDARACVTRKFIFEDDKYYEQRYLIIPKRNINQDPINTIEQTTHELYHLLRFKSAKRVKDKLVFDEGISTKTIDLNTHVTYRKNYMLEESIVQTYTLKAMNSLLKNINGKSDNNWFRKISNAKPRYKSIIYDTHIKLFSQFMEDETFKQLVEATFDNGAPDYLSKYYNQVMGDEEAFTRLSKFFNNLDSFLDERNREYAKKTIACILHEKNQFMGNSRYRRK